ncbi:MAG: HAD family hydrolase [Symploca sp. SIO1C4]|uniref:HAD family hydrolase n=1 Tax=Symploca sp. SIO1C4 TaxID=2607765 RepID=A0A6B3NI16_9CYAN|nr:HAD family hydrolase [Symploca sp. SIO1C4]NET03803.1 HAD family hydrolase [Symploca sp. SIO2B6]
MTGIVALDPQSPQNYHNQNHGSYRQHLIVFCDFDGPIVNVSNRYYATYKLSLSATQVVYQTQGINLPIQMLSKKQFWEMKQNRVADVEIAMRSGLQGEQIDFFLERVSEIVNQSFLLQKDRLQPGASWALALLHSQGVKLVLVTLRCQLQATQILRNHGLTRLFVGIYGTENQNTAYQNYTGVKTKLLKKAIADQAKITGDPLSAWMVGDTEADLLAAQELSIPTIALTCGIRSQFYLQQFQPTCIHSNLLAAAHYLLENKPQPLELSLLH